MVKASPRTDQLEQDVVQLTAVVEELEDDIGYLHYRIDELLSRLAFAADNDV